MAEDDVEALLCELDGIQQSPQRPWQNQRPGRAGVKDFANHFPTSPRPLKFSPPVASSDDAAGPHDSDVEEEIAGLLVDLQKFDQHFRSSREDDDPLASSLAHRIDDEALASCHINSAAPALDEPKGFSCPCVSLGGAEDIGQRPSMEDKSVLIHRFHPRYLDSKLAGARAFCAVFDGHNGSQVSSPARPRRCRGRAAEKHSLPSQLVCLCLSLPPERPQVRRGHVARGGRGGEPAAK